MIAHRSDPIPLLLATRNPKKGEEMIRLLSPPWEPTPGLSRLRARTLAEHPEVPEVVEDAVSFAGNARKKAAEVARALGVWVVADDSGLAVDALAGAPGVLSARYAGRHGDDEANNRKLLETLLGSENHRTASWAMPTPAGVWSPRLTKPVPPIPPRT